MTDKEKQLLLKDLCARLPYKVRVAVVDIDGEILKKPVFLLRGGWYEEYHNGEYMFITSYYGTAYKAEEIRPYLRPMSSMTEEEANEFETISEGLFTNEAPEQIWGEVIDWLNAHHFDHRGLIPKGLAIEVTEENNPYED